MRRFISPFQSFVRSESASGVLLLVAAVVAVLWANSPWRGLYEAMKALPMGFELADFRLVKPLLLWVNDGLMAVFFLYVGLEIKREVLVGELADRRAAALPAAAALGGMVVPALLYVLAAGGGPAAAGWGVPMATDIAFALGVLSLLGNRVPLALKVFLTALAIVDDLGAVLVIALFYTAEVAVGALVGSLALWVVLLLYGRSGGRRFFVFLPLGLLLWLLMLKSGVHATVAGVLIAVTVPMGRALEPRELTSRLRGKFRGGDFEDQEIEIQQLERWTHQMRSPLHETEHDLQPWVAYCIMPVFALFNAGFPLGGEASLAAPVALGAILGLVVGKPVGILAFSWLAVRLGIAAVPPSVGWRQLAGAGALAGIGFTMSLFIGALAFGEGPLLDQAKLGVMAASVVSAVVGAGVLLAGRRPVRS
ncbi:MAG TPA: Na+/H+ antiporter NhaA [Thermoanaerobaculia bacterium]|nr:Na+/H+ antiporter NhaA [Thermoanaerobaculia bacterium]